MTVVILSFILGVPRETAEEKEFGNFSIYEDPENPYSTFNFTYPAKAFDRITQLTEFNTLLHIDEIKEAIAECVEVKREHSDSFDQRKATLRKMRQSVYKTQMKNCLRRSSLKGSLRKRGDSLNDMAEWEDIVGVDTHPVKRSSSTLHEIHEEETTEDDDNDDDDAFVDAVDGFADLPPSITPPTVHRTKIEEYFNLKDKTEEVFV